MAIDGLHLDRIADHGVIGERIQQLQYGACLDAAGRIETDVEGIDYDGEASTRHGPRPLIFDRNAQTVAPCAGVERLHVEERISFHERRAFGVRNIEGTIELHLGGRRRGRCIRRQACGRRCCRYRRSRAQWHWLRSRTFGHQQPCRTWRGGNDERSGWIGVIVAAFCLRTFVPAGCARTSGLEKDHVAMIGPAAARSECPGREELGHPAHRDTKDITRQGSAIEQARTTDRLGLGGQRLS